MDELQLELMSDKHAEQVAVEKAIKNAALSSTGKETSWVQANGGGNFPADTPTKAKVESGLSSPTPVAPLLAAGITKTVWQRRESLLFPT